MQTWGLWSARSRDEGQVWLQQGRVAEALAWARGAGLSAEDDLNYLREYEHITLARTLLAQHRRQREEQPLRDASALLARLLQAADAGGRTGSVMEILVLQALAYRQHGNVPDAASPLEGALLLAEPEGYARLFVDEGAPMAELLETIAARDPVRAYARRLYAVRRSRRCHAEWRSSGRSRGTAERTGAGGPPAPRHRDERA